MTVVVVDEHPEHFDSGHGIPSGTEIIRTTCAIDYTCTKRIFKRMGKRVSLILKDSDEAVIAPFLDEGSTSFEVLRQWASQQGAEDITSEAGALRALLQAGAQALRDRVLDAGYADFAVEFNSGSADKQRRAARDRYVRRSEANR